MRVRGEFRRRQIDGHYHLIRLQVGILLRSIARQPMKFIHGNGPFASRALHAYDCVERIQRHAHIGRVGRDARRTRAEDGVQPVKSFDRGAQPVPGARLLQAGYDVS